jgi:hypothetical protein
VVKPGEIYRFEQEVFFDDFRMGSTLALAAGKIKIRRGSDGLFWDGDSFEATEQFVATTAAGGTADPHHFYDFTIPVASSDGEHYDVLMRAEDDPATEFRMGLEVRRDDALLDLANGVETGWTLRQMLRIAFSVLAGLLSGAETTEVRIRDVNDTKDRIIATVTSDGNRTTVVLDAS